MSKELQKRIITSVILFLLLIFFNFTNLFGIAILVVCGWLCIEFSKIFSKLVGPMLIKSQLYFKYLALQILAIFYILLFFG